jgi:hypothetical protein
VILLAAGDRTMLKVAVLILPLFLVACGDAKATAGADAKKPANASAGAPADPATAGPSVTGTVLETMDAGAYTYVRMKTKDGEIWAAVNQTALKPGAEIAIENAMWMENFESKTLNRKFETILFGTLGGAAASADVAAMPPGHPPTASGAGASADASDMLGDIKVDKATGKDGRTVAEIWAERARLSGVEVVVRAKVVKFNAQIMGRNWIHLRDGSGTAEKGDNDLTVTTTDVVAKGDVVSVRGKVAVDRDFTAGYAYPVLIEEARVIK